MSKMTGPASKTVALQCLEEKINVHCTVRITCTIIPCFRTKGCETGWQTSSQLDLQVRQLDQ